MTEFVDWGAAPAETCRAGSAVVGGARIAQQPHSAGADEIRGTDVDDLLRGGAGADSLWGIGGADSLVGGAGDDSLDAGDGADHLLGGRGNDAMTGGAGDDVFILRHATDGADTIIDWGNGHDRLNVAGVLAETGLGASDVVLDGTSVPGSTVLRIGDTGVSVTLLGAKVQDVDLSKLGATGVVWSQAVASQPVVLDQVPAYDWYHGCTPTSVASILGYWDLHGHPGYFDAEGWDQLRLTASVQDEISSPTHNARYDSSPDDLTQPDAGDTSIADFLHTSEGSLGFGWTWLSLIDSGIENYAALRGDPIDARSESFAAFSWDEFTREIDDGRPMIFNVDTTADGIVDHTVPVLGYDDRGDGGRWFGAYTTWTEDETVEWFQFRPEAAGSDWGVDSVVFIQPLPDAPSATVLATAHGGFSAEDAPGLPAAASEAWLFA
jgi:hypothetical protein